MEIKVLGSKCATSDLYLEVVKEISKELGINIEIDKVVNPEEIQKYGVSIGCLYGYCPGCNFVHEENSPHKYTPALVINEEIKFHSCFPTDDEFRQVLLSYENLN